MILSSFYLFIDVHLCAGACMFIHECECQFTHMYGPEDSLRCCSKRVVCPIFWNKVSHCDLDLTEQARTAGPENPKDLLISTLPELELELRLAFPRVLGTDLYPHTFTTELSRLDCLPSPCINVFLNFVMCLHLYACMYMWVQGPVEARRRHLFLWSHRQLWATQQGAESRAPGLSHLPSPVEIRHAIIAWQSPERILRCCIFLKASQRPSIPKVSLSYSILKMI